MTAFHLRISVVDCRSRLQVAAKFEPAARTLLLDFGDTLFLGWPCFFCLVSSELNLPLPGASLSPVVAAGRAALACTCARPASAWARLLWPVASFTYRRQAEVSDRSWMDSKFWLHQGLAQSNRGPAAPSQCKTAPEASVGPPAHCRLPATIAALTCLSSAAHIGDNQPADKACETKVMAT